MKALRSFTIRVQLPERVAALGELATNLRWSWDERTRDLFRWVDPALWETSSHDPVRLLSLVDQERLEALASDPAFVAFLGESSADLQRYLRAPRWFQNRPQSTLRAVAYFSPEFGIAEALPQYSGGLGVLAGDHLKSASGLGVPVTGIGLLYGQGYFRQLLNADGWQEERYPNLDPHSMALTPIEGVRIEVNLGGERMLARVWLAQVGRAKLYLLDTDLDDNSPEVRAVTDRLYGGGVEHRIRQEILLGIGGVRALDALGVETQVFHTNEGHAGFLGLERIRQLITKEGLTFPEAIESVRSGTIFTTHTPVSAGIDLFPRELMARYFSEWAEECQLDLDTLMDLGHFPDERRDAPFNMAVMGLRLAGMSNGVAQLHGATSRAMFQPLWPGIPTEEVPIGAITNGVHGQTWTSPEMNDLLIRTVVPLWENASESEWARVHDIRDDELWRIREQGKEALIALVRTRLRESLLEQGVSATAATWADDAFDPRLLLVGFARRFAAYKRATLLLSQPDRLKALLLDPDRPLQLVFAGKAHPADEVGKEIIRQLVQFCADPAIRHRIAFVENYDIAVARAFYQGSDVWLNTPRRPLEASGTSGQKAALNGAINCSILDGWWNEMYDGSNGWAIASAENYEDLGQRDRAEADSLFQLLEEQIIPLYYERGGERVPHRWISRVKTSLASLGPRVTAARMVRDYVQTMYEPTAARCDALRADGHARARALAAWKRRVALAWPDVSILRVEDDHGSRVAERGADRVVEVEVSLGSLSADDIAVELLHGPVVAGDEMENTTTVRLERVGSGDAPGHFRYRGSFACHQAGRHGFAIRVVPDHPDLTGPAELGQFTWASTS